MNNNCGQFGKWLREKLAENGMTQTDLANKLGCTRARVSAMMFQENAPRLSTIYKVAEAIGADPSTFECIPHENNLKKDVKVHQIKILQSFADAVIRGDKTFEVRKNDRGYQKGDGIKFTVLYDSDGLEMIDHPLMKKAYLITYVLSGWGIESGYCAFGIREVKNGK